jgi:hypothetical protein
VFLAAVPAIPAAAPEEKSEMLVQKPQTLTAKPMTFDAEQKPPTKLLMEKGNVPMDSAVTILEIVTGPIAITQKFTVRIFVNKTDADAHTSITDPSYVGRIRAMDSESRRGESGSKSHSFLIILGGRDNRFYKAVRPGDPFKLTLVPVGSEETLKGFSIPIKEIKLKVVK